MLTKPIKITLTIGQTLAFKGLIEQLIATPQRGDWAILGQRVLFEWYKRNGSKLFVMYDSCRLTFKPSEAYALNMLLKSQPTLCEVHTDLARGLIGAIDPKL